MSSPWNPDNANQPGQNPAPSDPWAQPTDPSAPGSSATGDSAWSQGGNGPSSDGWTQPTAPLNPAWGAQPASGNGFQTTPAPGAPAQGGFAPQGGFAQPVAPVWQDPNAPQEKKGLIGSLFDFSFRHFATPHIVRIVYIVSTVLLGLGALSWIMMSFIVMSSGDSGAVPGGILILVATPLVFLVYLAMIRMSMELYVAVTRLADDVGRIREELDKR